jgi:lipopolysaccharide export LptBFGC system permease protein LptF
MANATKEQTEALKQEQIISAAPKMYETLQYLNKKGGLGLRNHEIIKEALKAAELNLEEDKSSLKVFKIEANNETYYAASNTIPEALIALKELEDIDISDFTPEDTISEVPQEDWKHNKITYYNAPEDQQPLETTFEEHMKDLTNAEVFASSAWVE